MRVECIGRERPEPPPFFGSIHQQIFMSWRTEPQRNPGLPFRAGRPAGTCLERCSLHATYSRRITSFFLTELINRI